MVVRMPRPFKLYADGPDLYQHFVIPLGLNEDRLIRAIEVHPGNPKVVHHAHMFLDNTGQARILDESDPGDGYTRFGGSAAGRNVIHGGEEHRARRTAETNADHGDHRKSAV